ncbi:hypothetical protein PPL_06352 [Heterostelium album PN500]|uniref:Uncharacterized protein n=1 Tax=Heterostelium pallidum (strain ATCC 26659 / Pp 5 / PN500) TaxID=670386 RepID=D3BCX4_HETP5|nr:hypothetical protein PPL_06352 [Heterostelium album PN500]EFA80766.1 hypothetical protein PPL_06352 [Heterostelium album PN500]|eukprot:XP_020432885.1 hypothetical protein PPL_06352 [Heterostelium album PN500]
MSANDNNNIQEQSVVPTEPKLVNGTTNGKVAINPKYGLPQRNLVHQRLHSKKFFDSADWVLNGSGSNEKLENPAFNIPMSKVH